MRACFKRSPFKSVFFCFPAPQAILHITEDIDLLGVPAAGEAGDSQTDGNTSPGSQSPQRRKPHELPVYSAGSKDDADNLHDVWNLFATKLRFPTEEVDLFVDNTNHIDSELFVFGK